MKRETIQYRSVVQKKQKTLSKNLGAFLQKLRAEGHSDEQIGIKLGYTADSIKAWRAGRRFPKELVIKAIENEYGAKII